MARDVRLQCSCGAVHGIVTGVSSSSQNRIVCYCRDCQAFMHQLHRADLMNAQGGNEIVQVPPASVRFQGGQDQIRGLRLSDKGMYRFYASCCNMPLGNTPGLSLPFLGIPLAAYVVDANSGGADAVFGPPRAAVYGQHAVGTPPPNSTGMNPALIGRVMWGLLRWRLRGQHLPHPCFDSDTKRPRFQVTTLSLAERDALRPLCGPRAI